MIFVIEYNRLKYLLKSMIGNEWFIIVVQPVFLTWEWLHFI